MHVCTLSLWIGGGLACARAVSGRLRAEQFGSCWRRGRLPPAPPPAAAEHFGPHCCLHTRQLRSASASRRGLGDLVASRSAAAARRRPHRRYCRPPPLPPRPPPRLPPPLPRPSPPPLPSPLRALSASATSACPAASAAARSPSSGSSGLGLLSVTLSLRLAALDLRLDRRRCREGGAELVAHTHARLRDAGDAVHAPTSDD